MKIKSILLNNIISALFIVLAFLMLGLFPDVGGLSLLPSGLMISFYFFLIILSIFLIYRQYNIEGIRNKLIYLFSSLILVYTLFFIWFYDEITVHNLRSSSILLIIISSILFPFLIILISYLLKNLISSKKLVK